ncbi:hypothetical protein FBU30_000020 [Linnemannia zychae]|nr:hypothetical protein FBU30_000020 [Linnemannia zychae]
MSSSSLHPRPSSAPAPSLSASTEHLNISIQEQNVLDTLEDTDGIVNKLATKEYTFKSLLSSMTLCSLDSYANKRASVYSLKFRASNYFFSSQQQSPAHTALSTDSGQRIDTIDVKENTALRTNTTTAPLDSLYNDLNIQDANVTSSPTTLPDDRSNMGCSFRHNIFTTNAVKRCAGLPLSTPGARIKNTLQLVNGYNMLSETKRPPSSIFRTDDSQGTLLNDKQQGEADSIDFTTHEYYLWCVDQLVKVFVDSPLKSPEVITEIVLVGPLLQEDSYHNLLSYFITEFESSSSVDVNLLRSLVQLIECASYEYLVYKDLIKVATIISERLPKGDTNTNNYTYLLWALSRILDVMATDMVKDLDNNCDFQLISQLLINLKESNNLYVKNHHQNPK